MRLNVGNIQRIMNLKCKAVTALTCKSLHMQEAHTAVRGFPATGIAVSIAPAARAVQLYKTAVARSLPGWGMQRQGICAGFVQHA